MTNKQLATGINQYIKACQILGKEEVLTEAERLHHFKWHGALDQMKVLAEDISACLRILERQPDNAGVQELLSADLAKEQELEKWKHADI